MRKICLSLCILLIGSIGISQEAQPVSIVQSQVSTDEKIFKIPDEQTASLRTAYDAALRAEADVKVLEAKLQAAKATAQLAYERYIGAIEAARQEVQAPKEFQVDVPVFSKFYAAGKK